MGSGGGESAARAARAARVVLESARRHLTVLRD